MAIDKGKLMDMYRTMVRIRTFEDRVYKEFAVGNIPGFVHLYAGEEAIATGACANLTPEDYIMFPKQKMLKMIRASCGYLWAVGCPL